LVEKNNKNKPKEKEDRGNMAKIKHKVLRLAQTRNGNSLKWKE